MQYDVTTPDQYLEALDNDWRKEKLLAIRQLIFKADPDIEEGITYKMLGYGNLADPVLCLNAQKNYVSLYVGDTKKVDPDGELLKGLNMGKGCIRFTKTKAVEPAGIGTFISKTLALWQSGHDVGC